MSNKSSANCELYAAVHCLVWKQKWPKFRGRLVGSLDCMHHNGKKWLFYLQTKIFFITVHRLREYKALILMIGFLQLRQHFGYPMVSIHLYNLGVIHNFTHYTTSWSLNSTNSMHCDKIVKSRCLELLHHLSATLSHWRNNCDINWLDKVLRNYSRQTFKFSFSYWVFYK